MFIMLSQKEEGLVKDCRKIFNLKDISNVAEIEISGGIKRSRISMRSLPGVTFEVRESIEEIHAALEEAGLVI